MTTLLHKDPAAGRLRAPPAAGPPGVPGGVEGGRDHPGGELRRRGAHARLNRVVPAAVPAPTVGSVISFSQALAFGLASLLIIVIPGPSVLFVVGRALAYGRRTALVSVVGNEVGALVVVCAVAFGVGAMVERSVLVFTVVKLCGAAYLVFLGVRALVRRRAPTGGTGRRRPDARRLAGRPRRVPRRRRQPEDRGVLRRRAAAVRRPRSRRRARPDARARPHLRVDRAGLRLRLEPGRQRGARLVRALTAAGSGSSGEQAACP